MSELVERLKAHLVAGKGMSIDTMALMESAMDALAVSETGRNHDGLIVAAEAAASKLASLGNTFSSPRFTDRYGDGPTCIALAKNLRTELDSYRHTGEHS